MEAADDESTNKQKTRNLRWEFAIKVTSFAKEVVQMVITLLAGFTVIH